MESDKASQLVPLTPEQRQKAHRNLHLLFQAYKEGGPEAFDKAFDEIILGIKPDSADSTQKP